MAGIKSRAYTTSTTAGPRRPETPTGIAGAKLARFAELLVPSRGSESVRILLLRTMLGVSILTRYKQKGRGTVFILKFSVGAWRLHDIVRHVGSHLPIDRRLRIRPVSREAAIRMMAHARSIVSPRQVPVKARR